MKRASILLGLVMLTSVSIAAIPQQINYQGQLTASDGTPLDSSVAMTFRLYGVSAGGVAVWTESHAAVAVENGLFHVLLGSEEPIEDLFASNRWLGVSVGSDGEMVPRKQLVSVAHAYRVGTVDGATGGHISGSLAVGSGGVIGGLNSVAFGADNEANGDLAGVLGGIDNVAEGYASAVVSGHSNEVTGDNSAVLGGSFNLVEASHSVIGGGQSSHTSAPYASLLGGFNNAVEASYGTLGGGRNNYVGADSSVVAGGGGNDATGTASVIGGGALNQAQGARTTIGGGRSNIAVGAATTIGGGVSNYAEGSNVTISGGSSNEAIMNGSTVAGGTSNTAEGTYSTVSGGEQNDATGEYSTISGGAENGTALYWSAVGGGYRNNASNQAATVGGGSENDALAQNSTVGGGQSNTASGYISTISGGQNNVASGQYANIGGGAGNTASGNFSTVAGGSACLAGGLSSFAVGSGCNAAGNYSVAMGRRAVAPLNGCIVFADGVNANYSHPDTVVNAFSVRATGGAWFKTNSALTSGVVLYGGGSAWNSNSDSTKKQNIRPVDTGDILEGVCSLPMNRWSYKSQNESIEHIGPMAQDFWNVFRLGEDSLMISTIDPSGVALAAIQELAKQNEELRTAVRRYETTSDKQQKEIAELRALMQSLMAGMKQSQVTTSLE